MRSQSIRAYAGRQTQFGLHDAGNVIVARNLTTEQARRLTSELALKMMPADANSAPAPQPVAMDEAPVVGEVPFRIGERVRVIAKDNGLPGVEAMNETQTIDADGNLTLPLVGKVKVAGLTQTELAQKIPEAYRDAKSPTSATWVIDRLATMTPAIPAFALPALGTPASATTAPAIDTSLSLTPSIVTLPISPDDSGHGASTQPAQGAAEKDGQAFSGALGGVAGEHQGIDVTIRVVGQTAAATAPATQQMLPSINASTPNVASSQPSLAAPAATMPASAPSP
jgi:hypothetical protein